jgi:hypothetical protein
MRRQFNRFAVAVVSIPLLAGLFMSANAGPPPERPVVVTGKILDTSGNPIVAAYDAKKNVVASAHTNAKGEYSLGVPRSALHVDRKGKTFVTQVKSNFDRAVTVASTVIPYAHVVTEGNTVIKNSRGHSLVQQTIVVDSSLAPAGSAKLPTPADAQKMPGALMLKAVAPDRVDMTAVTQAYWMQQESTPDSRDNGTEPTIVGWMDPLVMASADGGKPPSISTVPINISVAHVTPSLVKHGDIVHVSATLTVPQTPKIYPIVVARDASTGLVWELKPAANGQYAADIKVNESLRPNDHIISVLAYAAEIRDGGRRPDLEEEIEKAKLWDIKRPFISNPLLVVSRNRADITLTVVPDTNYVSGQ